MAQRTRNVKALLNDRIDTLNRNAVEPSPATEVFRTASSILALVREKLIDDKDSIQLSEYFFDVCEVLKTGIQGKGANESVRKAFEDLKRIMCEIEQILRRGASTPDTRHNKDKIEGYKLKVQETLGTIYATSLPPNETLRVGEHATSPAPVGPHHTVIIPVSESACSRLIKRTFARHELPSLMDTIFSSKDEVDAIRCLLGDDAQAFVDVIDEALDRADLSPQTRKKCLKSLYKTCGRHALLPNVLKISVLYGGVASYKGGFADVWKGEHCGRDVAVKVIRTYSNSDLQKIIGRFCKEVVTWKALRHPNILPLIGVTMSEAQFAMISDWMANGNINDFVEAHPDVNRLELLVGVARGLIYIHNQGMIHGDLKGANILIDQTGNARLADFGLLTIISDPANFLSSSSYTQSGTARWMGPELIAPQRFGFKSSRPTKSSDCYALGMVIYETISGNLPFHEHTDLTVFVKVLEGERPPRGVKFTKRLWKRLELCWAYQPNSRPSIEAVLQCLEVVSNSPEQLSPGADEEIEQDSDSTNDSSGVPSETSGTMVTERSTPIPPDSINLLSPILSRSSILDDMDYQDLAPAEAFFGPLAGRDDVAAGPSRTSGTDKIVNTSTQSPQNAGGRRSASPTEPLVSAISLFQPNQAPRQLRSGSRKKALPAKNSKRSRLAIGTSDPADQHETPPGARGMDTDQLPNSSSMHPTLPLLYTKAMGWAMNIEKLGGPGIPVTGNSLHPAPVRILSEPTASISVDQQADSTTGGRDEGKVKEERKYCFCDHVSNGSMIGCDDPDCEREWYHLRCLNLKLAPLGAWYCDPCKAKRNKTTRNKAKTTRGRKRRTGGRNNAKT